MTIHKIFLSTALAIVLTGCGTTMRTQKSGFLSSYDALITSQDAASSALRARTPVDPARLTLGTVEWRVPASVEISTDERNALVAQLGNALAQQIRDLPDAPKGRPVVVRAAITQVATVSPGLNTFGTLLLIGPLDRGGAAVEIEALDPETGKQIAAMTLGYFSPLSELKARFSKLAPAELALKKAAEDFALLLRAPS
jgi:hypothetical protein